MGTPTTPLPATAVLDAPDTLAWKASGAVSREVEVTGTEMVRRRLLRRGLLSLADAAGGNASAGLKVKVAPRRNAGLPAQQVQVSVHMTAVHVWPTLLVPAGKTCPNQFTLPNCSCSALPTSRWVALCQ